MKLTFAFIVAIVKLANATSITFLPNHSPASWRPAGPTEERGPCPMLNALANHGYLPRHGKNISEDSTVHALVSILNIENDVAKGLFKNALTTVPDEKATTFSLADLSRHNIIEHDASLSRQDFYFGDDHSFNQTIFDETRSYWQDSLINMKSAAQARQARINTSNKTNPTFELDTKAAGTSYGESAAYLLVFGNKTTGTAKKSWVEYLFENERLPYELGWNGVRDPLSSSDFGSMAQRLVEATESMAV